MKELPVPLQDNGALISCLMISGQGPSHPPFLSILNTLLSMYTVYTILHVVIMLNHTMLFLLLTHCEYRPVCTQSFTLWITVCFSVQSEKDSKEEILKAFRLFDDDETVRYDWYSIPLPSSHI